MNPEYVFYLSPRQIQISMQNKTKALENKLGNISTEDLEYEITSMLSLFPDLPRAFFLRYLNSMYASDFDRAYESLLRYFDYCLFPGGKPLYIYTLMDLVAIFILTIF
jgi:hypothetical protein